MTLVVNSKYQYLQSWVKTLPEHFAHEGKIVYDARNQIRVMNVKGLALNVKRYCVPIWINRIVYKMFRKPKAARAYENALILLEKGISTPEPVAYLLTCKNGLLAESYLVTIQIPFSRMFYEFGEGSIKGREHIIRAFARFTANLHEKGVCHKDYSPGNILFDEKEGEVRFAVVDINRMEFGDVDMKKGCRNFERLWGNESMMKMIANEYAEARHFDTALCERFVLKSWRHFWRHTQTHFSLYD